VSVGELALGIGLIVGLFTGVAAFAGVLLNFVYHMVGSAGVNTFCALLGVMLVLAWRNAGMVGLDSFVIRSTATLSPIGSFVHRVAHRHPPLSVQPRTDALARVRSPLPQGPGRSAGCLGVQSRVLALGLAVF
jgi:hypothetical protein